MKNRWLKLLSTIADETDQIACHYFGTTLKIETKADQSPVTIADQEIEQIVQKKAAKFSSDLSVFGEEFGSTTSNQTALRLIIDPIDGTRNFIRNIPFFATLLAIEENGIIIAGLVSAPITKDRWWASKGEGAHHNFKPIRVSQTDNLNQALALHGSLYGAEAKTLPENVFTLLKATDRQRGFGDYYQHMLVAMGCADFALDFGLKPWDIAAIKIIVEEAGGLVTDPKNQFSLQCRDIITSNGHLHTKILNYF